MRRAFFGIAFLTTVACLASPAVCVATSATVILDFDTTSYYAGGSPAWLCAADFDKDGHPDLGVALRDSNRVAVLQNGGSGPFVVTGRYAVGVGPRFIAAYDYSGDGYPDLAVANTDSNTITLLKNDGAGGFTVDATHVVNHRPYYIGFADMSGTPLVDIGVLYKAYSGLPYLRVLNNNGNGTFSGSGGRSATGVSSFCAVANYVAWGVSAGASRDDYVELFQWGYPAYAAYEIGQYYGPASICPVDVDRDERVDLVTANAGAKHLSVLLQLPNPQGNLTFRNADQYLVNGGQVFVTSGDFDHDNFPDLVAVRSSANAVAVLRNTGFASFEPVRTFGVGSYPTSACTGDFDGDGKVDIATSNSFSTTVTILYNRTTTTDVVAVETPALPTAFSLDQNYPNPFNATTDFTFTIPQRCRIRVEVVNALGQIVATLADGDMGAGVYRATWDGTIANARMASTGVYFYRVTAGVEVRTRKMLLLK